MIKIGDSQFREIIFDKLKEVIDFPQGVQEITIKLSVNATNSIEIVHIEVPSKRVVKTTLIIERGF